VGFERGIDGTGSGAGEPVGGLAGVHEKRRVGLSTVVATGTLACPLCDAPVALFTPVAPATPLACPVCQHAAPVRDFLSLAEPTRPARVQVRVVARADSR
jgi:hypothetical protein